MKVAGEMKLADLAVLVSEMGHDDVIDFASGTMREVEAYGGWCGIKRSFEFDPDSEMFIIGHYGGDAYVRLYHISCYDDRIGDFVEKHFSNRIVCISKMLADFILFYDGGVSETITVEYDDHLEG